MLISDSTPDTLKLTVTGIGTAPDITVSSVLLDYGRVSVGDSRTLPLVAMIQSADSERLIAAIDAASGELSRTTTLLLEVNVSGEEAKHGLAPDVVESLLVRCADLEHVTIRGLMAMAGRGGGPEAARADFARLRQLRDRLRSVCPPGVAPSVAWWLSSPTRF